MSIRKILPLLLMVVAVVSCKRDKQDRAEKEFSLSGFEDVYTSEKINLTIERGASFRIRANGTAGNIAKLELKLTDNNNTLDISYKEAASADITEIVVTMPHFGIAYMSGDVKAVVRGFQYQVGHIEFVLSGRANVTAHDGASIVGFDVTGNSKLFLHGHTASLAGTASGDGVVDAYGLTATRAYITTMQQAKAYVKPLNIFFGAAEDNSRIYYKGDPAQKELVKSGNGDIIKE